MAKTRIINTRFWIDDYTANLDPVEKLLFLYFLTNTATEICGIYEIPIKTIAIETGIESKIVEEILKRFTRDKKVFYIDGWVYVVNFTKHQTKNPSVEQGIKRCLGEVPQEIKLKAEKLIQRGNREGTATPQRGLLNLTKLNLTKPKGESRFAPPSLKEVSDYCKELNNGIDASQWIDFYASKGWFIGKNKMKNWKAAVRTWGHRDKQESAGLSVITIGKKNG